MSGDLKKKDLFRIALAAEGISAAEFARRNNVTRSAVYQVLSGDLTSRALSRSIDRYIRRQLAKHKIKVGAQL